MPACPICYVPAGYYEFVEIDANDDFVYECAKCSHVWSVACPVLNSFRPAAATECRRQDARRAAYPNPVKGTDGNR